LYKHSGVTYTCRNEGTRCYVHLQKRGKGEPQRQQEKSIVAKPEANPNPWRYRTPAEAKTLVIQPTRKVQLQVKEQGPGSDDALTASENKGAAQLWLRWEPASDNLAKVTEQRAHVRRWCLLDPNLEGWHPIYYGK
jgi:hypothetical protein